MNSSNFLAIDYEFCFWLYEFIHQASYHIGVSKITMAVSVI